MIDDTPKHLDVSELTKEFTFCPNSVLDLAMDPDLDPFDFRVLMYIVRKTYGFNVSFEQLSLRQIEKNLGMSRNRVIKSIKNLLAHKHILKFGYTDAHNVKHVMFFINNAEGRAFLDSLKDGDMSPGELKAFKRTMSKMNAKKRKEAVHQKNRGGSPHEPGVVHQKNHHGSPEEPLKRKDLKNSLKENDGERKALAPSQLKNNNYQEKAYSKPQPKNSDAILTALMQMGLTPAQAQKCKKVASDEQIKAQIAAIDARNPRNRAAVLFKAITEEWPVPQVSQEAQADSALSEIRENFRKQAQQFIGKPARVYYNPGQPGACNDVLIKDVDKYGILLVREVDPMFANDPERRWRLDFEKYVGTNKAPHIEPLDVAALV